MSCDNRVPLMTLADRVADILSASYVDRDDPRINNGILTSPSIRGGFLLDNAAKLTFCGYVQNCITEAPTGKMWVDRPIYPNAALVSYESEGETKVKWDSISNILTTNIPEITDYEVKVNPLRDAIGAVVSTQDVINRQTITPGNFGAKADGSDDTARLQKAVNYCAANKIPLDGVGKTYHCSNVVFDSNLYFKNANLVNNANADLMSVLTTVISREWLENVTFENIHINGMRVNQTNMKAASTTEDGGRHGFRIRRPCKNIRIRRSSANFCASDGICIFPDIYNGGNVGSSIINFVIEDSEFLWNRRHGGSSDRTDGMEWINSKFNFNGRYIPGYQDEPLNSGRQGDTIAGGANGGYYGSGWDVEEYEDTTASINLKFINCEMLDNAKGGLIILPTLGAVAPAKPSNIQIIGGRYNKGVLNPTEGWGITITPNGVTNTGDIFENTIIAGVTCTDTIVLRNNKGYTVVGTPCTLNAVEHSSGYSDGAVRVLNSASTSKNSSAVTLPAGKLNYLSQFNLVQLKGLPSWEIDSATDGAAMAIVYTKGGAARGKYSASVSSARTRFSWQATANNVDNFRIEEAGVSQVVSAEHKPANRMEMTFEATSDTEITVNLLGSDMVLRTGVITLT